jgi:D-inositol-3-phosphate glycosyltransferase
LRIAMVSEHASPLAVLGGVDAGGQNVHVAALAGALAGRGHDVTVYTRRDDPSLPHQVRMSAGVTVEHVDAGPAVRLSKDLLLPYMDEFAVRLMSAWENGAPDIVHSHFWMSGRAALAAADEMRIPVVHTFHALGVVKRRHQAGKDTSPPERIDVEKDIIRRAAWIISTCSDEVFELKRLGATRDEISVIPCGVDVDVFSPAGPAWRRSEPSRIVVLSRLVERKGIGDVITALQEVPGAELLIAGGPPKEALWEDPEARRLRSLAREVGVAGRVAFLGRVDRKDVPGLLRSADVVACVPWYEPFGIVPLEAMACGIPVVATAVGGMIDTVVDGVSGLHVPPHRPDRVAAALRTLLADAGLRRTLGSNASERAARFAWTRVAEATESVYRGLAAGGARRGVLRR